MGFVITNNKNKGDSFSGESENIFLLIKYNEIFKSSENNQKMEDEIRRMKYFVKYDKLIKQRKQKFNFWHFSNISLTSMAYLYIYKSKKNVKPLNLLHIPIFITLSGFCILFMNEISTVSKNKLYLKELFENKIIMEEMLKINNNFYD